jgi:hypothetical protein
LQAKQHPSDDPHEISELERRFSHVADRLTSARDQLQSGILPQIPQIVEELVELGRAFELEATRTNAAASSLEDLRTAIKSLRDIKDVLDRLSTLQHRDDAASPHVALIRAKCAEFRERLLRNEPGTLEMSAPFLGLAELVESGPLLTDEGASELSRIVEAGFGRGIAIAALRGTFQVAPRQDDQPPTSAPNDVRGESRQTTDVEVAEGPPVDVVASTPPPITPAPQAVSPETVLGTGSKTGPHPLVATDGFSDYARVGDRETGRIFWDLVAAGRYPLAFQIARVMEKPPIPPGVIKASALALALRGPVGDIAAALKETFETFGAEVDGWEGQEHQAVNLLVAAATLRPGLLAPLTGATAILRSVKLEGELALLAQTVVYYGERLRGPDPMVLRGAGTAAEWEEHRDAMVAEARELRKQAAARTLIFAQATDVWRALARPGGVIHELLAPIAEDDGARSPQLELRLQSLDVEREIDQTHSGLRATRRGRIVGKARGQIQEHAFQRRDPGRRRCAAARR